MSTNATLTFSDFMPQILNGTPGLVICFGNGLLLLTVLLAKSLRKRKEMLMVAGLATADFLYGLGNCSLAIYRITLMLLGVQTDLTTAWNCIVLPPVFLTYIGSILVAVMNGVISIDRYMSVARPAYYRNLSRGYALKVLSCVGIFGLAFLAGMFASTYFGVDTLRTRPRTCVGTLIASWFAQGQYITMTVVGLLSVALYVRMYFTYRTGIRQVASGTNNDAQQKVQRRLTVTLGIIVVCTLFLFIMPSTTVLITGWMKITLPLTILQVIGSVTRLSTIFNMGIYIIRQKDIRSGMWRVLRCRNMDTVGTVTIWGQTAAGAVIVVRN